MQEVVILYIDNLHQMGKHLQLVHILAIIGLVLFSGAGNFIHMKRLENFIREKREQLNLKQQEVAELLNVSASTYSRWERGEKDLSVSEILRVSQVLFDDSSAVFAFLASPLAGSSPIAVLEVVIYDQEAYKEFLDYLSKHSPSSIGLRQQNELWKL